MKILRCPKKRISFLPFDISRGFLLMSLSIDLFISVLELVTFKSESSEIVLS